ncbi:Copper/zinc superoxide dismutase 2 isoform 1 [Hibiscus syriacus]|uniref:Copper/zinc superoxide dismutase 2 isoform 1 n=1 Tax=Hibiscus syriacus TaxID=106335 RepID=A0A6A3CZK5_HIBSY|nr:Copper/zinc superoxide dismutase 2 isoform 1 [Hibiscus syriacus]
MLVVEWRRNTIQYRLRLLPVRFMSTEEEEDMANCLIMLAQSDGPKRKNIDEKFEMVTAMTSKAGAYAYEFFASQVSNNSKKANCYANKGNKIHECSICGSEFSSGQALGGHMRRHRAAAAAATASNQAAVSVDSTSSPIESNSGDGIKPRSILSLDLNLPAPEDDPRESKFQFGAPKQAIVFSTPALVDCHY